MGNTVYDWTPLFQGISSALTERRQQKQYEDMLDALIGNSANPAQSYKAPNPTSLLSQGNPAGMTDQEASANYGSPGLSQMAPQQQQQAPARPGILHRLLNTVLAQQGANPAQGAQAQQAPQAPQGMTPEEASANYGSFQQQSQSANYAGLSQQSQPQPHSASPYDLFRKLPPQIGMPLLLQTMQSQMGPHKTTVVAPGGSLVDETNGKSLFTAPEKQENTDVMKNAAALGLVPGSAPYNAYIQTQTAKAPIERKFRSGSEDVTQQYDQASGQWTDVGRGAAFAPPDPSVDRNILLPLLRKQEAGTLSDNEKATLAILKPQPPTIDPNNIDAVAKGIANYQQAPLTGTAMRNPANAAIMARVYELNPAYHAQDFGKSSAAYREFGSGKKGDLVRSFNVSISHLGTLENLTQALGNGDTQAVNSLRNTFREQFGQDAPSNFNAAKAIVGDEIIKAIVGGGGALQDRENAQNQINSAKSPQQLMGVIRTYKELMAGQLTGLKRQYEQSTMRNDFNTLLSPDAQTQLEGLSPPANAGAPAAPGWSMKRVQ